MTGHLDMQPGRATGLTKEPQEQLQILAIIETHGFALIKALRAAGYHQVRSVQVMPLNDDGVPMLTMPMLCIDLPKVDG